jgi:hypothetical protein
MVRAPAGDPAPDQARVQGAVGMSGPEIPVQGLEMSDPESQGRWARLLRRTVSRLLLIRVLPYAP